MKLQPLISVVIPSYNHAHYIVRAVDALLRQHYANWEVVIVDNNSIDNTDEVLARYSDPRIRVYKINNEGIIASSRNKGIEHAKGEWVAFLDSDDWWTDNKLQECANLFKDGTDFIYHNMTVYLGESEKVSTKILRSGKLNSPVLTDLIVNGNNIINSSVVVRKHILDSINGMDERKEMVTSEDYHCWLKAASKTDGFVYINKSLGFYTIHQQGMSQRDVIQQTRVAIQEFLPGLSSTEQQFAEAFVRYFNVRNIINTGFGKNLNEDLLYCLKFGKPAIRIKAILSWIQIVFGRSAEPKSTA